MHDPFDLKHDGKLDDYERSVRDHHMMNDDFDIYNSTRNGSSSGYYRRSGKNYRPQNNNDPDSAKDHFVFAIGFAFLGAIGVLLCNIFSKVETLFGLIALATFLCGIGVIVAFIKGLIRLFRKNKVAGFIVLGIALAALSFGAVKFVQWRFRNSPPPVADTKEMVTEGKNVYSGKYPGDEDTKAQAGTGANADAQAGPGADAGAGTYLANVPKKYRKVLRAAESTDINFLPVYKAEMDYIEWINQLSVPGNAFSDYVKKMREALKLDQLNKLEYNIVEMLFRQAASGRYKPLEDKIPAIIAGGYSKDGTSDKAFRIEYGKGQVYYGHAVYMNNDKYIFMYYGFSYDEGSGKKDVGIPITLEIDGPYARNFVDMSKFRKDGKVTTENVTEDFSTDRDMKYRKVDFKITKEMKQFLYVVGTYAHEVSIPREAEKENAEKEREAAAKAARDKAKTSSGKSSGYAAGKSSGSGKSKSSGSGTKKEIDPDDLDIEGYYEDYKEDFEDVDDAWDDLMDNPDMWEDYEQ